MPHRCGSTKTASGKQCKCKVSTKNGKCHHHRGKRRRSAPKRKCRYSPETSRCGRTAAHDSLDVPCKGYRRGGRYLCKFGEEQEPATPCRFSPETSRCGRTTAHTEAQPPCEDYRQNGRNLCKLSEAILEFSGIEQRNIKPSVVRRLPVNEPVARPPVARQPVARPPVARPPVARQPVARQPVARQPVARQPVVVRKPPVVRRKPPVVRRKPPVVRRKPPVVRRKPPVVRRKPPVVRRKPPVVRRKPVVARQPVVADDDDDNDEPIGAWYAPLAVLPTDHAEYNVITEYIEEFVKQESTDKESSFPEAFCAEMAFGIWGFIERTQLEHHYELWNLGGGCGTRQTEAIIRGTDVNGNQRGKPIGHSVVYDATLGIVYDPTYHQFLDHLDFKSPDIVRNYGIFGAEYYISNIAHASQIKTIVEWDNKQRQVIDRPVFEEFRKQLKEDKVLPANLIKD